MTMLGIDVASVNDSATVLAALKDPKIKFAIFKATEGLHWNDPDYFTFKGQATSLGKLTGAYHYWWPDEDPVAQAKHFLTQIGFYNGKAGGMILGLDAERMNELKAGSVSWPQVVGKALAFLDYVKHATGCSPVLYVNQWWQSQLKAYATPAQWARLISYPIWDAEYSRTPGVYKPTRWAVMTMEQYTDAASGPGWSHLDGDWFNGDARTWAALAVPGASSTSPLAKMLAAIGALVVVGGVVVTGHVASGTVGTPTPAPLPSPKPPVVAPVTPPAPAPAPRPPVVAPTPPAVHLPAPSPRLRARLYIVRRGETLDGIAHRHGTTWQHLAGINRLRHPGLIYPGQVLRLDAAKAPAHSRSQWVRVRPGDTLDGIARAHHTTWQHVASLTGLSHPGLIHPGEQVRVR